ncbi:daptide biosynthesis RiPP recognition protein [Microbacterium sp. NPDC091662]|uniref:daptide biosynthesis RiPP recognition protein n=1 Tax=Microbacterium sp. NPDC091662 TaxID=3364211 RepID=UPI00381A1BED
MNDGGRVEASELDGVRALREWITGQMPEHSRVFLLESGAPADDVAQVARRDDTILLPVESGTYDGPGSVVRYRGALRDAGDELFFGERGVELQDYVAAAFVQIIGPTAVRFFDASSWQVFLEDAELARRTGIFPSALIDPRVLLADRNALDGPGEIEAPRALRVSADGSVGIGVQGRVIGTVDELPSVLDVPRPRATALGGVASGDTFAADLASRDWIGRYLNAADLMKMLRLENGAARISGFGWFPIDDALSDAEPLNTEPFLLETADGFVLADTATLRRQLLTPSTARAIAAIQTSSSTEIACERVARLRGTSLSHARALCLEARDVLNVHVGRRAGFTDRPKGDEG